MKAGRELKTAGRTEVPLRILQVVKGLDIGGLHGGAERFSMDLARALPRDLYDVAICAFFRLNTAAEKRCLDRLQDDGLDVFFASDWKGRDHFPAYYQGVAQLQRRLRSRPVDIVHSHFQLGTIAGLWLKATRCAHHAIRTAHLRQEWDKGWYGWLRDQLFSNWLFPLGLDAEVGVSQAIVDYLQAHSGAAWFHRRTALIYNAIPSAVFNPPAASSPSHQADNGMEIPCAPKDASGCLDSAMTTGETPEYIVGTVGRLTEQKGYTYLLQAAQRVVQEMPGTHFWIFGDGELRNSLEEESRALGLSGRVLFWGQKDGILEYVRRFDLFALPSLWEGLPTVLMESMACEVAAVATDIPGTREMIQHGQTGWLVPARDAEQLAGQILFALKHPEERKRVARQALQRVGLFSMETVAEQYHRLYQQIISL